MIKKIDWPVEKEKSALDAGNVADFRYFVGNIF